MALIHTPKVLMNSVEYLISSCLLCSSQPKLSPINLTVPSTAFKACLASRKANLVLLIKKSRAVLAYSYLIAYFNSAMVIG